MAFYNYSQPTYNNYAAPYQPNYQPQTQVSPAQQMQPQPQPQTPIQVPVPAPRSNMTTVTSLMEAMSRMVEPNTDIFYAHQDKPYIYRISVDTNGRKTYKTFELKDITEQEINPTGAGGQSSIDLSNYVTKAEYNAVAERLEHIEIILNSAKSATKKNIKSDDEKE